MQSYGLANTQKLKRMLDINNDENTSAVFAKVPGDVLLGMYEEFRPKR